MAGAASLQRVIKRDGFEEQYDPLKLRETLAAALETAGEIEALREQFATTIELRVAREAGRVAEAAALAEQAIRVMEEYGCARAAAGYRAYRFEEEQVLAGLRVHGPRAVEGLDRKGRGSAPWDRARLQRALMRDRHLERAVARMVARRVERRLACLGYRHLTSRLLAALADNEARVMGLRADPLEGAGLGFSRAELRAWLGSACLPTAGGSGSAPSLADGATDPRPLLGEELLARFALEELWTEGQRESLQRGVFEVLAMGDWTRPQRAWLRPGEDEEEEAFWQRVGEAFGRAHEVQVHWPAARGVSPLTRQAPRWLASGGRHLRLATSDPVLAGAWCEAGHHVAMPVAAFLGATAAERRGLKERETLRLQWQPPRRLPAASEMREQLLQGAAVVNLPLLASEAGAFDVDRFLRLLREALDRAAEALGLVLDRAGVGEHPAVALLPAGLDVAMDLLLPDASLRRSRGRRLLLDLRPAFQRAATRAGLRLDDRFPPHPQGCGRRLADRDGGDWAPAYAVGWWPGPASRPELALALDAAPWLEGAPVAFEEPELASRLLGRARPTAPAPPAAEGEASA